MPMLLLAVVLFSKVLLPNATLFVPVVLFCNAPAPTAAFLSVAFKLNALCPTAVFRNCVVTVPSAL